MGFFGNIGATREIDAYKLAKQIYSSFHRDELMIKKVRGNVAQPGFIAYNNGRTKAKKTRYRVFAFRDLIDLQNYLKATKLFLQQNDQNFIDPTPSNNIYNYNEILKCGNKWTEANIMMLKQWLLDGFEIMWWDRFGNEHGYCLH